MIQFTVVLILALGLALLVRARLIQVDLLFPWFFGVVVLGFASTSSAFVEWLAALLGILYPPIAIVFLTIFLLVGVLVTLTVAATRLRARQAAIVRDIAGWRLDMQEAARSSRGNSPVDARKHLDDTRP